ncbi:type II secretion system F family protein [Desulfolucanica intricata]|uniref:type II secretion system F family protein n=1 Tax=Desulfolucanica intricata TaxID=1285191 RepID=UPI0008305EF9|nr:type II secretion system F family protein [Desulfolucanica intricata]
MNQQFKYRICTKEGCYKKGVIYAQGLYDAASFLRRQDYWIIDINPVSSGRNKLNVFQKGVSVKELAFFTRQFASLINSGIPVLKALKILSKQNENKKFKHVLTQLINDLETGSSLSDALACYPQFFPKVFTSMIAAGEAGGVLGQVLEKLSLHYEKIYELTERLKSALTYPALVILFALISLVLLFTMVLPTFEDMLADLDTVLPVTTLMIIKINRFLLQNWYYVSGIFFILCIILTICIKSIKGKEILDSIIIRIPAGGRLLQKFILARFCRTFSTLINSGVPILTALEIVKETIGNTVIIKAVSQAFHCIEKGESIAVPLQKCGFFPPMLIHMIAVGEETGSLGQLLEKSAAYYDLEIDTMVSRISSLIEPLLVLLIGGIVGFVVIVILLPIYQTIGAFG